MAPLGPTQTIGLSLRPARARREVETLLARHGWDGDTDGVVLALHEALVNAQRHGGGALRAEAAIEPSCLVVRVWDRGPGFALHPYDHHPPDPMSERGRGLWLISQVTAAAEVCYHDDGVALVMRFDRRPPRAPETAESGRTKSEMLC